MLYSRYMCSHILRSSQSASRMFFGHSNMDDFVDAQYHWEICVPTHFVDKAVELLQSEPHSASYHLAEPWDTPSSSLLHTWHRFKHNETDFCFVIVPDRDVHIVCEPSNFTRSLRGLPYPKLDVFIQSCLDSGDELQLCDVIDGTDLPEEWGEENLELDGTNDVEWANEANRRSDEYKGGKYPNWSPFACNRRSRRAMWQSYVRTKRDRMDWAKPSHVFTTQYHIIDTPDSWTVLSDDY